MNAMGGRMKASGWASERAGQGRAGQVGVQEQEQERGKRGEHLAQFGVVNEVRSVSVDEGTQGQAILPAETQTNDNRGEERRRGEER